MNSLIFVYALLDLIFTIKPLIFFEIKKIYQLTLSSDPTWLARWVRADPKRFEHPRANRIVTTESILLFVASRHKGKNLWEKNTRAYDKQAFKLNSDNER